jgi:hypothetical protein
LRFFSIRAWMYGFPSLRPAASYGPFVWLRLCLLLHPRPTTTHTFKFDNNAALFMSGTARKPWRNELSGSTRATSGRVLLRRLYEHEHGRSDSDEGYAPIHHDDVPHPQTHECSGSEDGDDDDDDAMLHHDDVPHTRTDDRQEATDNDTTRPSQAIALPSFTLPTDPYSQVLHEGANLAAVTAKDDELALVFAPARVYAHFKHDLTPKTLDGHERSGSDDGYATLHHNDVTRTTTCDGDDAHEADHGTTRPMLESVMKLFTPTVLQKLPSMRTEKLT